MKLRKILSLFVLVFGLSFMTGCGKEEVEEMPEKKEEVPIASVEVQYLSDMDSMEEDDCTHFVNPRFQNSEYLEKIVIVSDQDIENVKVLDVELGTVEEDVSYFFVNDTIFQTKSLDANEPLLIETEFTEFTPNLVFSYEDTDGEEKMFSISMSGKDSSLVVAPALLEKGKKPVEEPAPVQQNEEVRQYGEDIPVGPYDENGNLDYEAAYGIEFGELIPVGPYDENGNLDYEAAYGKEYGELVPIGPYE